MDHPPSLSSAINTLLFALKHYWISSCSCLSWTYFSDPSLVHSLVPFLSLSSSLSYQSLSDIKLRQLKATPKLIVCCDVTHATQGSLTRSDQNLTHYISCSCAGLLLWSRRGAVILGVTLRHEQFSFHSSDSFQRRKEELKVNSCHVRFFRKCPSSACHTVTRRRATTCVAGRIECQDEEEFKWECISEIGKWIIFEDGHELEVYSFSFLSSWVAYR